MTEQEWRVCADPSQMLELLRAGGQASERKLRLFAVACVRRLWGLLRDERSKKTVEVAERFADGLATEDERLEACDEAERAFLALGPELSEGGVDYWNAATSAQTTTYAYAYFAAEGASRETLAALDNSPSLPGVSRDEEARAQAALLRDLFGSPLRPFPSLSRTCLARNDGVVLRLAQTIYASRGFEQLPILADALEEAGCTDAELLAHLRGPGPHAAGCWALDAILRKE